MISGNPPVAYWSACVTVHHPEYARSLFTMFVRSLASFMPYSCGGWDPGPDRKGGKSTRTGAPSLHLDVFEIDFFEVFVLILVVIGVVSVLIPSFEL